MCVSMMDLGTGSGFMSSGPKVSQVMELLGAQQISETVHSNYPRKFHLVNEHIALHGAGEWGGAEFNFNCAQIEVESDSSVTPYPLVQIPGVYDGYEPGILFYMYRPYMVNYTMPGPQAFPDAAIANITASGISVAPTVTPWTVEAVTRFPSSVAAVQSSAKKSGAVSSKSTFVNTPLVRETNAASSLSLQMTEIPGVDAATTPTSNVKAEAGSTGTVHR